MAHAVASGASQAGKAERLDDLPQRRNRGRTRRQIRVQVVARDSWVAEPPTTTPTLSGSIWAGSTTSVMTGCTRPMLRLSITVWLERRPAFIIDPNTPWQQVDSQSRSDRRLGFIERTVADICNEPDAPLYQYRIRARHWMVPPMFYRPFFIRAYSKTTVVELQCPG
jgi:hypothetical protein